jgi:hypothetical protein
MKTFWVGPWGYTKHIFLGKGWLAAGLQWSPWASVYSSVKWRRDTSSWKSWQGSVRLVPFTTGFALLTNHTAKVTRNRGRI